MSDSAPSKRLPKLVDPRKLAVTGATFYRYIEDADLPRLAEAANSIGRVSVEAEFFYDDEGRCVLEGKVSANLDLQCQSCLQDMPFPIEVVLSLVVVWDEERAKALPQHRNPWIVGEGEADLHAIIEEELLLELPVVARHEQACLDKSDLEFGEPPVEEERENPFQALAQLKNSGDEPGKN